MTRLVIDFVQTIAGLWLILAIVVGSVCLAALLLDALDELTRERHEPEREFHGQQQALSRACRPRATPDPRGARLARRI